MGVTRLDEHGGLNDKSDADAFLHHPKFNKTWSKIKCISKRWLFNQNVYYE